MPSAACFARLAAMWLVTIVSLAGFAAAAENDSTPNYTICRTACPIAVDGCLGEPAWRAAQEVGPFQFPWYHGGERETTSVRLLWDDQFLYAGYVVRDKHISARFTERDQPVYEDDCVELFTAPNPQRPEAYFNFEMNARAVLLDQHHPHGRFSGLDHEWNSHGVQVATQLHGTLNDDRDEDARWTLEVAIPWSNFRGVAEHLPPQPGDQWRLNLNRCGGETNPQYSQWSPSVTEKPDFHRPETFGTVIFTSETLGNITRIRRWRIWRGGFLLQ